MSTRQSTRIPFTCVVCKSPFTIKPSHIKRRSCKVCSRKCQLLYTESKKVFKTCLNCDKPSPGRKPQTKFCSPACCVDFRRGKTTHAKTFDEFFDSHIDKSGECWTWSGTKNDSGYGQFRYSNTRHLAHRVSWSRHNHTEVPDGMIVCHHCDNPPCVRPDHLFLGTYKDNMQDMILKGRKVVSTGESHYATKLTKDQVLDIRSSFRSGESKKSLQLRFSLKQTTLSNILLGKSWKHV